MKLTFRGSTFDYTPRPLVVSEKLKLLEKKQ